MTKMAKMANQETGTLGNTKTRVVPSKRWCMTLNNYSETEFNDLITMAKMATSIYIIGKEVGENGTPHLQGFFQFKKITRPLELKNISKRIHWEKTKGSIEDNIKYCSKEGNFVTNQVIEEEEELEILKEDELYDWQKEIVEIVKQKPDKRKIYWYWDEKGDVGKTTFGKYLSHVYGAIPVEGKKNDILFCAAQFKSKIYVFDFERTMEEFISYGAMEKIKNGYFMCAKYESKPVVRNSPHVICFANFEPNREALSKDRWVIRKIEPKKDIIVKNKKAIEGFRLSLF